MRFNPKARLDTSRMRQGGSGRSGSAGGRGLPIPSGAVGRGGIGTLVVVVLLYVAAQALGLTGDDPGDAGASSSGLTDLSRYDGCTTGEDANSSLDCARVAIENSLSDYWAGAFGDLRGYRGTGSARFEPVTSLYTFSRSVDTGCGPADSSVGPFYCPSDASIYLDTTFFDDVLERQLGGPDGAFVEFYVIAHEYGHHISNLLGSMGLVTSQATGPQSQGVRLELQADCFAGMWAAHATRTRDADGQVLVEDVTKSDLDQALAAAAAVGDDRIEERTQGRVTPESWTHGSAEQRQAWFTRGFEGRGCDTFAARRV